MKLLWKRALKDTIPVLTGYLVLGFGFGIIMKANGFGILLTAAMSLLIYAGSMQYAAIGLMTGCASLLTVGLTTLMVNARHLFYGISMLEKYRDVGKAKPYLIFGLTEEFLTSHPDLHLMTLKSFSALARENGLLVVQAHPFRNGMRVMPPEYLDGIETFNGHRGHDSRNPIADAWAKRYGLIETSGTDFHHPTQSGVAGILTDQPITSMNELVSVLKSGNYTLHCAGPRADAEGIADHPAKS